MRNKEVKIVYCPTEKMIADYSSKPTQGKLFEFQRNTIQGIKVEDYRMYKEWYMKVLEQYKLFDDLEHDLFQICTGDNRKCALIILKLFIGCLPAESLKLHNFLPHR